MKKLTLEDVKNKQFEFARYLRDPKNTLAPKDIDKPRMDIYRRLFINNIKNFLKSTYRRTYSLLGKTEWDTLIRDYYRDHRSKKALFPELAGDFLEYLINERPVSKRLKNQSDPPWLNDLAHYECVLRQLKLSTDQELIKGLKPSGDLIKECPIISKLTYLLSYKHPVEKISPTLLSGKTSDEKNYYIAYRNKKFDVKTVKINFLGARLFELLRDHPERNGREHLETISSESKYLEVNSIEKSGLSILEKWREKQIILGTLPKK
ncbi:MAG: putative DNA-binding domain-containing protein [Pseudomonadota bacterium]|nr:putative DNA-binding domain-containing protein [Pseudomonadota bacterium]